MSGGEFCFITRYLWMMMPAVSLDVLLQPLPIAYPMERLVVGEETGWLSQTPFPFAQNIWCPPCLAPAGTRTFSLTSEVANEKL
jgi:hypothetical protein